MGRFILSESKDWQLEHDDQNIRGWKVIDATGKAVGRVADLIADTDTERVEAIRLTDGREFPADEIQIGEEAVYLEEIVHDGGAAPVVAVFTRRRIRRRDR